MVNSCHNFSRDLRMYFLRITFKGQEIKTDAKKLDWEKISIFVQNFLKISTQTSLTAPIDHSVKLWNNFCGLSKPISPMYFLTGFHWS